MEKRNMEALAQYSSIAEGFIQAEVRSQGIDHNKDCSEEES